MEERHFQELDLVCPECRKPESGGMKSETLQLDCVQSVSHGDITTGLLSCPKCRAEYPIIEGVPCILRDVVGWLQQEVSACPFSLALPGSFSKLVPGKQPRTPEAERAFVSAFADFHYGDADENRSYWKTVIGLTDETKGPVLDLGCSVGRLAFESGTASLSVGLDLRLSVLVLAERFRRQSRVAYERRLAADKFESVETEYRASANVLFIAGDALDPPFRMESFDRVSALNLLDNVNAPLILLGQMDALLRPGGAIILGSPYEWREDITPKAEWFETRGGDSASVLKSLLTGVLMPEMGLRYSIESEHSHLSWTIRNHARYHSRFMSHLTKARKPSADVGKEGNRSREYF